MSLTVDFICPIAHVVMGILYREGATVLYIAKLLLSCYRSLVDNSPDVDPAKYFIQYFSV